VMIIRMPFIAGSILHPAFSHSSCHSTLPPGTHQFTPDGQDIPLQQFMLSSSTTGRCKPVLCHDNYRTAALNPRRNENIRSGARFGVVLLKQLLSMPTRQSFLEDDNNAVLFIDDQLLFPFGKQNEYSCTLFTH
jgi:hypothetical protein